MASNGFWQDPHFAPSWPYAPIAGHNAMIPPHGYGSHPVQSPQAVAPAFYPLSHDGRFADHQRAFQSLPSYYMGHDLRSIASGQAHPSHHATMLHKQHAFSPASNHQMGLSNGINPAIPSHHSHVPHQGFHYDMHAQLQPLDVNRMPATTASNPYQSPTSPPHLQRFHTVAPSSPQVPRGPPRKPKRSGHAIWVGNIPMGASIEALKDHFSRDATMDIESVFLMAKSNCAFVNYVTEDACLAAVERFNHSLFGSVRLLCRIRRDPSSTNRDGSQSSGSVRRSPMPTESTISSAASSNEKLDELGGAVAGLGISHDNNDTSIPNTSSLPPRQLNLTKTKPEDRYFVLKSLTKEDLQESLMKGTWETQAHNQQILHDAFYDAKNVYLVFSVNKSGEYFGYARMISSPMDRSSQQSGYQSADGVNHKILNMKKTLATATAPRGHIIDDPPRGILFWEAEHDNYAGIVTSDGSRPPDDGSSQPRSRPFQLEWLSVRRVTFQRTKGMRNAWNSNKEVKVARDGTELETETGKKVVGLFHERYDGSKANGL